MSAVKDFIFRDVRDENESSKPAIELRLAVLGMMGYFLLMTAGVPWSAISEDVSGYYQVINTVSIYMIITIYGCLISSNFLSMEKKLIETNKKLRYQAGTDPLTQLMNRLCMIEYAAARMEKLLFTSN